MPLVDPTNKNNEGFNPTVDNSKKGPKPNPVGKFITYISFILIIPMILYISKRNGLVKLQMKINESASGIDVQLKKRKATLLKLVDATKSSMKYEKTLLNDIVKMRNIKGSTSTQLSKTDDIASRVNATFEAYPDLKTTRLIEKMQEASIDIEREIGATRRLYNSYVTKFNSTIFMWPASIPAAAMKLVKFPLFKATEEDKKDVSLAI